MWPRVNRPIAVMQLKNGLRSNEQFKSFTICMEAHSLHASIADFPLPFFFFFLCLVFVITSKITFGELHLLCGRWKVNKTGTSAMFLVVKVTSPEFIP